jgi:hypothetical protein
MSVVARIATSFLVMVASATGLLALPLPCTDEVSMSQTANWDCGPTCACCADETCTCTMSPKAPAPQSAQPALLTPSSGPTHVRTAALVTTHPASVVLADVLPPTHPLDRFAPTAGPRQAEHTFELFCTLLV